MRIFLDTADLDAIKHFAARGLSAGVTTNPAIIARDSPGVNVVKHIRAISKLVDCVSVQLAGPDDDADKYLKIADHVFVKVPLCNWGLDMFERLDAKRVNITAICTEEQAVLACALHPAIVSIFWNRSREAGGVPRDIVDVAKDACGAMTSILVGSVRTAKDVLAAAKAGADIITMHPKLVDEAMKSEATEKILKEWYPAQ